MRHPASILHDKSSRTCYLCVTLHDNWNEHRILDEHHVFGGPNRKNSEEYGLKRGQKIAIIETCKEEHKPAKKVKRIYTVIELYKHCVLLKDEKSFRMAPSYIQLQLLMRGGD